MWVVGSPANAFDPDLYHSPAKIQQHWQSCNGRREDAKCCLYWPTMQGSEDTDTPSLHTHKDKVNKIIKYYCHKCRFWLLTRKQCMGRTIKSLTTITFFSPEPVISAFFLHLSRHVKQSCLAPSPSTEVEAGSNSVVKKAPGIFSYAQKASTHSLPIGEPWLWPAIWYHHESA